MENENEHYLADWLAGTISDDQFRELVSEDDFLAFQQIKSTLAHSQIATPEKDSSFAAIQQKLAAKKTVRKQSAIPMWTYAVAACLIISFGWYQLYFLSNETQTDFGNNRILVLSDRSKVTLNAKSKIGYSNLFRFSRKLELQGEAFFEVEKGSAFTVKTALGNVTVLGTKFDVASFSDYFEVVCFEGKVRVEAHNKTIVLTQGESVRFYAGTFENWADAPRSRPLWINGETDLKKVPMKYVFAKFEDQFNVKVTYPKNIENTKFTGSFTNTNIETALKSICIPLQLKYSNTSGSIRISE